MPTEFLPKDGVIVGDDHLVMHCGDVLLDLGIPIRRLFTDHAEVIRWAMQRSIPCHRLKQANQRSLYPQSFDYLFSISNPIVLRDNILKLPKEMALNYHNSLLPRYRGQNATAWALINDERTHGYSWHLMDQGIDTGAILWQRSVAVTDNDTAESLNIRCHATCAEDFKDFATQLVKGRIRPVVQMTTDRVSCFSRKDIPDRVGAIDWNSAAEDILRLFRAFSFGAQDNPLTCLKVIINHELYIVSQLTREVVSRAARPGDVVDQRSAALRVKTKTDVICLERLLTLQGDPVDILEINVPCNLCVSHPQVERLTAAYRHHKRNEAFWVKQLTRISNDGLRFIFESLYSDQPTVTVRESLRLPRGLSRCTDTVLALILGYLYRLSSESPCCFLKKSGDNPYNAFCEYIPFGIEMDRQTTFDAAYLTVALANKNLALRGLFCQEVFFRYPALTTQILKGQLYVDCVTTPEACRHIAPQGLCHFIYCTHHHELIIQAQIAEKDFIKRAQLKTIKKQLRYASQILANNGQQTLSTLPLLRPRQVTAFYDTINDKTPFPYAHHHIWNIFLNHASSNPSQTAIIDHASQTSLSYDELLVLVNTVSAILQQRDVGEYVCLQIDDQLLTLVWILATINVDKTYVMLPDCFSACLIRRALSGLTPFYLVTDHKKRYAEYVSEFGQHRVGYSDRRAIERAVCYDNFISPNQTLPSAPAYIMFTSGSTGTPKGVKVGHEAIIRLVKSTDYIAINAHHRIALSAPLAFDAATFSVWGAFLNGATLVILSQHIQLDSQSLKSVIQTHGIDTLWLTARLFDRHVCEDISLFVGLKNLLVGGDVVSPASVTLLAQSQIKPPINVLNGYGPTENTTFSTVYPINLEACYKNIPIGKPIRFSSVYVVDNDLHPLPPLCMGEIVVGGVGLSLGYTQTPARPRFISTQQTPLHALEHGDRVYRTGDYGMCLPDGNVKFFNRKDHEVKIRGHRINVATVEDTVSAVPGVLHCGILSIKVQWDEYLLAMITIINHANGASILAAIKKHLNVHLPQYAHPTRYHIVEEIPLTQNGKIDRHALQALHKRSQSLVSADVSCSKTDKSSRLIALWKQLLQRNDIEDHTHFFDAGGHSLSVMTLISRVKQHFSVEVNLSKFLENPTVSAMLQLIIQKPTAIACASFSSINKDIHLEIPENTAAFTNAHRGTLLTGASGFLGKYLLRALLRKSDGPLFTLVRDPHSIAKINAFLQQHEHWNSGTIDSVRYVIGDLTQPKLGLTQNAYRMICHHVDTIYHAAAQVNHVYAYSQLRQANVRSTDHLLRLMRTGIPKQLHYISSLSALPSKRDNEEALPTDPNAVSSLADGYSQTKWASEFIIARAIKKKYSVHVYRPGWILGDTRTGYCPTANHLIALVKSCVQLGVAPDWKTRIRFLPVDFMAEAIVTLGRDCHSHVYNLTNLHHVSWQSLIHLLNNRGYPIKIIPIRHWLEKYIKQLDPHNALFPFQYLYTHEEYGRIQGPDTTEDIQMTRSILELNAQGMAFPLLDESLLDRYIAYLEEIHYLSHATTAHQRVV